MSAPYYADSSVTLYHGDMREVLPTLGIEPDCVIADPPYGETSLEWDRWPDGWPGIVADYAQSMWCFGSMRMFLDRRDEFFGWKLSQDIIWEKHNGSGFVADRFKRVHEIATHWYRRSWDNVHREVPRVAYSGPNQARRLKRRQKPAHTGEIGVSDYEYKDSRLAISVIKIRSMHGYALHPTEKPVGILDPLIRYACPPGGLVLDPFAGSGSTAVAARLSGRRSVLIEAREDYCELTARRLSQDVLPCGEVS